jgi:hypothetical protein
MKGSWCKKKTCKKRLTRKTAHAESDFGRKTYLEQQISTRRRNWKGELRIPLLYSQIWPLNRQDERKGGLVVDWSVILPAYPYTLCGICSQRGMLVLEDAQKQERSVC